MALLVLWILIMLTIAALVYAATFTTIAHLCVAGRLPFGGARSAGSFPPNDQELGTAGTWAGGSPNRDSHGGSSSNLFDVHQESAASGKQAAAATGMTHHTPPTESNGHHTSADRADDITAEGCSSSDSVGAAWVGPHGQGRAEGGGDVLKPQLGSYTPQRLPSESHVQPLLGPAAGSTLPRDKQGRSARGRLGACLWEHVHSSAAQAWDAWNAGKRLIGRVIATQILVMLLVVGLLWLSIFICTLPWTIPAIIHIQAATMCALFEGTDPISSLGRSKQLMLGHALAYFWASAAFGIVGLTGSFVYALPLQLSGPGAAAGWAAALGWVTRLLAACVWNANFCVSTYLFPAAVYLHIRGAADC